MTRATITFLADDLSTKPTLVNLSYEQWLDMWKTGMYQHRIIKSIRVDGFDVTFRDDPQPAAV